MMHHWFVPSRSHPGEHYEVMHSNVKGWVCECAGFVFRRTCSHIRNVQEILAKKIVYLGRW